MTHDPESFFRLARSIRLQGDEFEALKQNLRMSVRNDDHARLQGGMDRKDFLTTAQKLSLTAGEKSQILAAIKEDMVNADAIQNPFRSFLTVCSRCLAAVMIFVLCGAGVSYAAESALPGDALYAVKVNFTEPILMRLNTSAEAKARMEARLAGRRLEEIERLAEKSELTAERVAIVQERLKLHITALESDLKELATLDQESSGSIAIDTAAELEAHENLLEEIHNDHGGNDVQKLIRETRKGRALAERATVSAKIHNRAEITIKKAEAEIQKTKSNKFWQQRSDEDAMLADAILNAENDLKGSVEEGIAADIKIEKASSALKKAKKAKFMLLLPGRPMLKNISPKRSGTETEQKPNDENHNSSSSHSDTSSSSSLTSSSSASTKPSSSSSHSSSLSASSSSVTSSVTSSISVSASASASTSSAGDMLDLPKEPTNKLPSL